jgi:hypothetical protein
LYVQIFRTNVVLAAFSSFVLALAKNLYKKCARITLMKLTAGVARLFCSLAKFENYFSSRAALFKIVNYDKITTSAKQEKN